MFILAAIAWFALILFIDIFVDYKKWIEERIVNHALKPWERFLFLVPSLVMLHQQYDGNKILGAIIVCLLEAFVYWTLFDGIYNVIRGFNWWFFGSFGDPGGDAKLDVFQKKLGLKRVKLLKFGGIIITLILYII